MYSQEVEAKEIKEGKARPKVYDNETGLPIEDDQPNYQQNLVLQQASQRRQYQQHQPAVQQPYQPQYQQVPDQQQLFRRQQYRQ